MNQSFNQSTIIVLGIVDYNWTYWTLIELFCFVFFLIKKGKKKISWKCRSWFADPHYSLQYIKVNQYNAKLQLL